MPQYRRLLARTIASTVAGSLLLLAFAPVGWWWVAPLALAVLFGCVNAAASIWQAFFLALAFGVAFFSAGVIWIYQALVGYIGLPVYAGVPFAAALYVGLALFPAVGCAAAWAVTLPGFGRVVALAAGWTAAEWLRGWLVLGGFPWLALGYSQVPDGWLAGWIPLLGVYGATFASALTAAGVYVLCFARRYKKRLAALPVAAALLFGIPLVLNNAWSWTLQSGGISVSVLQGNVRQALKWEDGQVEQMLSDYLALAESSTGRVVVFPETAFPMLMRELPQKYVAYLRNIATKRRGAMVAGAFLQDKNSERFYNGVHVFAKTDIDRYRKMHLTPYGEYIPFASVLEPLLRRAHIPFHSLLAGDRNLPLDLVDGIRAGISICYEDAFGEQWREQYARSHFLINMTNDAWFDGSQMPAQHLQIAQTRALESGRWLVRASNTGESAVVDARGRVVQKLDKDVQGVLTHTVPLVRGHTLYTFVGDAAAVALAGVLATAVLLQQRRRAWRLVRARYRRRRRAVTVVKKA